MISEGVPDQKPKYVHHYKSGESGLSVSGPLYDYIESSDSVHR